MNGGGGENATLFSDHQVPPKIISFLCSKDKWRREEEEEDDDEEERSIHIQRSVNNKGGGAFFLCPTFF